MEQLPEFITRYAERYLVDHNQDISNLSFQSIMDTLTPCALPVKEAWVNDIQSEIIRLAKENENGQPS